MRQSVASLRLADTGLDPGILQRATPHLEGDAVITALDVGRVHQATVGADRQKCLADGARIARAEAGEGRSRDFAAALLDRADHERLGALGSDFRRQLVQHQPVEVGAVAEGRVELAAQPLGAFGIVVHHAAVPEKPRHGGDQRLAGSRLRRGDDRGRRPGFDDAAMVHDGDPVGERGDHGEVVRDEQIAEVFVALQFPEQRQDFGAHGDVERRHRFVEHDERRPRGDGAGDGNALALAAGNLVDAASGNSWVEPDALEQRRDGPWTGSTVGKAMDAQGIVEHAANRGARIERGERLLEHHLEACAAKSAAPRHALQASRRHRSGSCRGPAR